MKLLKRNKLVYGVGINDADYNVCETGVVNGKKKILRTCPYYLKWKGVLERCYSDVFRKRNPSYKECTVVEEWKRFSNFKAWMETQDWEGKQLDKDLLVVDNKIYGPETCVFVDQKVNLFLLESNTSRGKYPIGVHFDNESGKYRARCCSVETNKQVCLGRHLTPEDAYKAWLDFKLKQAYILAESQTDQRVAKALVSRYESKIDQHNIEI